MREEMKLTVSFPSAGSAYTTSCQGSSHLGYTAEIREAQPKGNPEMSFFDISNLSICKG